MHDLKANKEGYQGQGLIASSIHLYYETLVSRFYRGWRFRKDTIETEEQFKELVDGKRDKREAFLMLTKTGEIIVNNERDAFSFKGASTLISYASPEELGS